MKTVSSFSLDQHQYDDMNSCWIRRPSKPQPFVEVSISTMPEDYSKLGFSPLNRTSKITVRGMADTGCQSCLMGLNIARKLGIKKKDLIPVTMKMQTANNDGINILGVVIIRLAGNSTEGKVIMTRQIAYITDQSSGFFISREACVKPRLIPPSFPTIGEAFGAAVFTPMNESLSELLEYHKHRKHPWTTDGVALYKNRIIIPPALRNAVLSSLHAAHQGISTMTAKAESSVFWPGITRQIISLREWCNDCNRNARSQASMSPTSSPVPAYPFQHIAADFFKYQGTNYLVAVDRYSN